MDGSSWRSGASRFRLDSWDALKDALAVEIQHLKESGFRYIVISDSTRYVQLASLGDGSIHSEASDCGKDGVESLSPSVCKRLQRLGWLAAEAPASGATRRARAFLQRWPRTTASDEIAEVSVRTLRDVFGIASPATLTIRRSEFSERSVPTIKRSGQWVSPGVSRGVSPGNRVQPPKNRNLHLPAGSIIRNAHSGRQYRVENLLGAGGFGAAYRATQVSGSRLSGGCVLKIATDPQGWHREAYFGELLRGEPGIVGVYETFAWVPQGDHRRPLYCLVSELAEGGDLARHLRERPVPWTESRARREITRLARAVKLLHASGAVHRDITPGNVLVTPGGVLKLGDFGIALHRAGSRNVAADAFAPRFAPLPIRGRETVSWKPADDVYQLGQLFAFMLIGSAHATVTPRDVKTLSCSAEVKAVIQRCIGERRRRFANAEEMLGALGGSRVVEPRRRVVRSLRGKRVVFTGSMGHPQSESEETREEGRRDGRKQHQPRHRHRRGRPEFAQLESGQEGTEAPRCRSRARAWSRHRSDLGTTVSKSCWDGMTEPASNAAARQQARCVARSGERRRRRCAILLAALRVNKAAGAPVETARAGMNR